MIMNDEPKLNANREKKQQIMASLVEKMKLAKAIVFTNYQGLTHKQLEEFKKQIKTMDSDYVVAKNSLILRSVKDASLKIEDEKSIEGPTGTMFIYQDIVAPLKALAKVIKELGLPSIKIGLMDGAILTKEDVTKLASLPGREVLLAQLVGVLKGPIFGLHRSLNWNIQKLVMTLSAVAKAKPTQAAVTTPVSTPNVASPVSEPEPTPAASVPVETPVAEAASESAAETPLEITPDTTEKTNENQNKEEVN
jgi:large subunit ribosomal protein L10